MISGDQNTPKENNDIICVILKKKMAIPKCEWIHRYVFCEFYKGEQLCDFLFASLDNFALQERVYNLKKNLLNYLLVTRKVFDQTALHQTALKCSLV